jgi:chromosome segregation ATPase
MRKQATSSPKAELEAARAKISSLSTELQAALSNSMALSKELAATKEKLHTHEKQAIQLIADAKRYQDALKISQQRLQELESEDRAAQSELAELRAELAEAWSLNGKRFHDAGEAPSEPVLVIDHAELSDAQARAMRVEEDLRFERMHVQQLERRLNSWTGLASAALRKITRLGGKPAPARRKPHAQHHMPPPIASRS